MGRSSLRLPAFLLLFFLVVTLSFAEDVVFGGVGLQVVPTIDGNLVVLNVLENAPAAEKGMLPGDLIYQVDDFVLQGSDFGEVVSGYLWGPVGSSVTLYYRRPGVEGEGRALIQRTAIEPRLTVSPAIKSGAGQNDGTR